jgi:Hsp70 protein
MKRVLGIDLGTTHVAAALSSEGEGARDLPLPQLLAKNELGEPLLLPSFVYLTHESEAAEALPWDPARRFAVGEYARARGLDAPGRVVFSAKSWLSHAGVDRRAAILPANAVADVEKVSPVEASFRYLEHVVEALRSKGIEAPELNVVLTVPASFDPSARELTVEAALAAGLDSLTLLEEPQAALYAWLARKGEAWRKELAVGDVVLVVDVGGGTTDFSAIVVREREGALELERIAVGEHILLGGDNMDLYLAHVAEEKLATSSSDVEITDSDRTSLVFACRAAKEALLSESAPRAVPIAVGKKGSKLVGRVLRTELTRAEIETVILEGFFPEVPLESPLNVNVQAALRTLGLPYAREPAVTKHLAKFLRTQRLAMMSDALPESAMLAPTKVLFNGGVLKPVELRHRIMRALNGWLRASALPEATELGGADFDLSVARGAAAYGLAKQGRGIRIRGAAAQAYYVGVESNAPSIPGLPPPVDLLCIAPFGMEEGTSTDVATGLGLVVGEHAEFRFFRSQLRRDDAAGARLSKRTAKEAEELSPVRVTLSSELRKAGSLVPVSVRAELTEVGVLKLFVVPESKLSADESWEVSLSLRSDGEGPRAL